MNPQKSRVLLCPFEGNEKLKRFYLELKNDKSELVDVRTQDFSVTNPAGQMPAEIKRLSQGRYLLEVTHQIPNLKQLRFTVQNQNLKHDLKPLKKASLKHSKLTKLSITDHTIKFSLELKDEFARPVETQASPEVVIDGIGNISELTMLRPGHWEFEMTFSEENQIIQLSVRANGILLERLYRHQHVEK